MLFCNPQDIFVDSLTRSFVGSQWIQCDDRSVGLFLDIVEMTD